MGPRSGKRPDDEDDTGPSSQERNALAERQAALETALNDAADAATDPEDRQAANRGPPVERALFPEDGCPSQRLVGTSEASRIPRCRAHRSSGRVPRAQAPVDVGFSAAGGTEDASAVAPEARDATAKSRRLAAASRRAAEKPAHLVVTDLAHEKATHFDGRAAIAEARRVPDPAPATVSDAAPAAAAELAPAETAAAARDRRVADARAAVAKAQRIADARTVKAAEARRVADAQALVAAEAKRVAETSAAVAADSPRKLGLRRVVELRQATAAWKRRNQAAKNVRRIAEAQRVSEARRGAAAEVAARAEAQRVCDAKSQRAADAKAAAARARRIADAEAQGHVPAAVVTVSTLLAVGPKSPTAAPLRVGDEDEAGSLVSEMTETSQLSPSPSMRSSNRLRRLSDSSKKRTPTYVEMLALERLSRFPADRDSADSFVWEFNSASGQSRSPAKSSSSKRSPSMRSLP